MRCARRAIAAWAAGLGGRRLEGFFRDCDFEAVFFAGFLAFVADEGVVFPATDALEEDVFLAAFV